jgi:Flp pilus assembly protein TadD/peroxiredoxin
VVRWPGGIAEEFRDLVADRHYVIVQGSGSANEWRPPNTSRPLNPGKIEIPVSSEQSRIVLVGRVPLPDVRYVDSAGQLASIPQQSAGPVLINLWATWCQPCLAELQEFSRHADKLRQEHLNVVALCVDELDNSSSSHDPNAILSKLAYPFVSGSASRSLVMALDVLQRTILDRQRPLPIPCSFLIDQNGQLAIIYKGPTSVEQLLADLGTLDMEPQQLRDIAVPFAGRWETPPAATDPQRIAVALYDADLLDMAVQYTRQMGTFLTEGLGQKYMAEPVRNRKLTDSHAFRGVIHMEQNRLDDAVSAFTAALETSPRDLRSHMRLGEAFVKKGRLGRAAEHLATAVSIVPDDPILRYDLAMALTGLGRQGEANQHYREALRLRPGWPPAANNLAWILATHADPSVRDGTEAVKLALQTCQRVQFRDPKGLDTLAAAQAEAGDFAAAKRFARQAVELATAQGKDVLADKFKKRLQTYELGKPYRDLSLSHPSE